MKSTLRYICSPILNHFESGEGPYSYKKSHRTILIVVGSLFLVLSSLSVGAIVATSQLGAAIPILVFFITGLVCLIVGGLGTDRAVAKIWGSK